MWHYFNDCIFSLQLGFFHRKKVNIGGKGGDFELPKKEKSRGDRVEEVHGEGGDFELPRQEKSQDFPMIPSDVTNIM